nr:chaperone protein DnaJ 1, mitochondrial isoform X2 [Ipomoea batatas]
MDVKVTIPPGVDSGDTIRVQRAGHAGRRGMQPGNLFIKLKVDEDSVFDRDGADIYVDANISFTQVRYNCSFLLEFELISLPVQ